MKGDFDDPKALIREAYNIEAITRSECRSIFLDWALSLPLEQNSNTSIQKLLKKYNKEYYIDSNPSVSDNEYDFLKKDIFSLYLIY